MPLPPARRTRLSLQRLETRETPAAGAWAVEAFDDGPPVPTNWGRWPAVSPARVVAGVGPDASPALVLPGGPLPGRTWNLAVLPADYGVRAAVRAEGPGAVQVLVRGQRLGTDQPSYYAVSTDADGTVRLVRTLGGHGTVLASTRAVDWPAGRWVEVSVQPTGSRLIATVRRPDTGHFLNAGGRWQEAATAALTATDGLIPAGGQAGVNRPPSAGGRGGVDDLAIIAPELPAGGSFDTSATGGEPAGWQLWRSDPAGGFRTTAGGLEANAFGSTGGSTQADRAWMTATIPADATVTASVRADLPVAGEVLVRGRDLGQSRPTYYAASVVRGVQVRLLRVADGEVVELGRLKSASYLSAAWLDVTLSAQGDRLQVRVRRLDTGDWLNRVGQWQADPAAALDATDSAIRGPGLAGLGRAAGVAGTVLFDNVRVAPGGDLTPPTATARVQPRTPAASPGTVRGVTRFLATASDRGGMDRVEFLVDGEPVGRQSAPPYRHDLETRNLMNGRHTLSVRAWDSSGNLTEVYRPFVVANPPVSRPVLPRHYSHIRVAALAYNGNPLGPLEHRLLRESIDLVIPNARYLAAIDRASPATPQLVYSNVSNLYLELLTDWLAYADGHGLPREGAFYHAAQATPFVGDSPSSQPVNWFWNVARGPLRGTTGFTSATVEARQGKPGGVPFGDGAIYIGSPDRFREINLTMIRSAAAGWSGVLEYPTTVDAAGRPSAWKALSAATDSTNGLRRAGRLTFDPPKDWQPAVVPGSTARLLYVRIRTVSGTAADVPVAGSVLGRDYVGANGGQSGTIPAFDTAADANQDGHLTDAEFARRRPGFDARFAYEARLFYPHYGQMRFVTNPSGTGVPDWAADYHRRLLSSHPLADGLFMDNSGGRLPSDTPAAAEATETYAPDFAAVLGAVNRAVAPKWVMANTSGGGIAADRVVRQVPATIEEFALRPLTQSWSQFQELSDTVARRLALGNPPGYLVIDSLSAGGSPTDPRTRMAALAAYYLLADPQATLFMAWGGEEPASGWSRHWWDAIGFDVGRPAGPWSEFAGGTDASNTALTFKVLQRTYDRALVLYKPLSYATGKGTGGTGEGTATIHRLPGNYRLLNADGTLGPVTRLVTLRGGEGAILVKA